MKPRLHHAALFLAVACIETGTTPEPAEPDLPQPIRDETDDPRAPTADAGEDRQVAPLEEVILDGSRSYDPAGLDLIPLWTLVAIPEGSQAELDRADDFRPVLFPDVAGDYEIALWVENADGVRSKHADHVVIHAVPEDALYVQLTWNTDVDLDLHVLPDGAALWGAQDCTWCNREPEWGRAGVLVDDPSLDWDVIDGYGPETVTVPEPAEGGYSVFVDVYGQGGLTACRPDGCPPTVATLDVYMDGERIHRMQTELTEAGQLWEAIRIDWPAGEVRPVDTLGWTDMNDCTGG